jgi:hypothetical protein
MLAQTGGSTKPHNVSVASIELKALGVTPSANTGGHQFDEVEAISGTYVGGPQSCQWVHFL